MSPRDCPDCDGSGESAESIEASLRSTQEYLSAPACTRCGGEGWIDADDDDFPRCRVCGDPAPRSLGLGRTHDAEGPLCYGCFRDWQEYA